MQKQKPLFDPEKARAKREDAIARVSGAQKNGALMQALTHSLRRVCESKDVFTADDVWADCPRELWPEGEPRVMGAALRIGRAAHWCEPTSGYRPSKRVACHGRPQRVWISLIVRKVPGSA